MLSPLQVGTRTIVSITPPACPKRSRGMICVKLFEDLEKAESLYFNAGSQWKNGPADLPIAGFQGSVPRFARAGPVSQAATQPFTEGRDRRSAKLREFGFYIQLAKVEETFSDRRIAKPLARPLLN